jgi:hypothetical protein
MSGGGRVRILQASDSWNIASQFQNPFVVNLIEHGRDFPVTAWIVSPSKAII